MTDTEQEIEVFDGRPFGRESVYALAGKRDLGHVRKVAPERLRAFELTAPLRVLTARGEELAESGDVLIVAAGQCWPVQREYYERWYEPAGEHDDGAKGSADALAAIRLAVMAAGNDRAALTAVQLILDAAPPSDQSRTQPVQLLQDAVRKSSDLRFALTS